VLLAPMARHFAPGKWPLECRSDAMPARGNCTPCLHTSAKTTASNLQHRTSKRQILNSKKNKIG
jgi:hypothetical protein